MSGTNDVNSDNRGIMIETPDQGRITVPWKKFRRLSLERGLGSGSAIDDFPTRRALSGTVIDADGTHWRGRIVFDLDEAYTWDIFNGTVDDLEYDIPFALIASVERADKEHSWVTLRSGQRLRLGDSPDAGRGNDGLLIFSHDGAEPDYIPWRLVDRVEFRD